MQIPPPAHPFNKTTHSEAVLADGSDCEGGLTAELSSVGLRALDDHTQAQLETI